MTVVAVRNLTRQSAPRIPFLLVANKIVPGMEISLVFVGIKRAQNINKSTRNKKYIPNVLSYIVGKNSGEIIICITQAKKEAKKNALTKQLFILLLFIHALLHLKGYRHGTTMEQYERLLLTRFSK